ncbi:MAG: hypothetical protein H0X68_10580 [Chloroflexi bacterium]|nr:hypothetical protein [Chloroflexota bacterium]
MSFDFTTEAAPVDETAPTTSDVTLALRAGGQATPNGAPTLLTWVTEDNATAAEDLVHQVQRRQSVPRGWSGWGDVGTVTGAESLDRDENPLGRAVQYRVRTTDQAGNLSDWAESNVISISMIDEKAFSAPSWSRVKVGGSLGGHVYRSSTAGAVATLAFTGDGVGVVMPTGSGQGTVELCVDHGTDAQDCSEVNLGALAPAAQRQVVAVFTGLDSGHHTLRVRVVAGTVNLDAALVSTP